MDKEKLDIDKNFHFFFQIQIFTCPYLSNTRVRQNLTQIHFRLGLGAESITNVLTLCRVTHITALPTTSHYVPVVELSQIDPFFMAL
jgi:hypothetical protein